MSTLGFGPVIKRLEYKWGEVLSFGNGGGASQYCGPGWATPEAGITWTMNPNVRLSLSVSPPKSDITMLVSCLPFLGDGRLPHQELHVYLNFLRVGFALIKEPGEVEFWIPGRLVTTGELDFDFYLPKACSPASLGTGPDIRDLGIAVNQMMLLDS